MAWAYRISSRKGMGLTDPKHKAHSYLIETSLDGFLGQKIRLAEQQGHTT